MDREPVLKKLEEFCDYILHTRLDKKAALEINQQIDDYCQRNNVTIDERQVFITTGAGDELWMLCSMPD